jgi:hypothetical protein
MRDVEELIRATRPENGHGQFDPTEVMARGRRRATVRRVGAAVGIAALLIALPPLVNRIVEPPSQVELLNPGPDIERTGPPPQQESATGRRRAVLPRPPVIWVAVLGMAEDSNDLEALHRRSAHLGLSVWTLPGGCLGGLPREAAGQYVVVSVGESAAQVRQTIAGTRFEGREVRKVSDLCPR